MFIATGFYEWQAVKGSKKKQPKAIQTPGPGPMIFAGLWEENKELGPCATIVTTEAPAVIFDIHDRCPAILGKGEMEKWLDPTTTAEQALELCVPYKQDLAQWDCWSPEKDKIPVPPDRNDGRKEQRKLF